MHKEEQKDRQIIDNFIDSYKMEEASDKNLKLSSEEYN
jgi:hypothetical protein